MIITQLEQVSDKKYRVFIDDSYCFLLTNRQIKYYSLINQEELSEESYQDIYNFTLKRAKIKALELLKITNQTEYQMNQKLKKAGYTDSIIKAAVEYVKSYNYINDYQYAVSYINTKTTMLSKRQIISKLLSKGIDKDIIKDAIEECGICDDTALDKIISKKVKNYEFISLKEKQKLYNSLVRKGFRSSEIIKILSTIQGEDE